MTLDRSRYTICISSYVRYALIEFHAVCTIFPKYFSIWARNRVDTGKQQSKIYRGRKGRTKIDEQIFHRFFPSFFFYDTLTSIHVGSAFWPPKLFTSVRFSNRYPCSLPCRVGKFVALKFSSGTIRLLGVYDVSSIFLLCFVNTHVQLV